MTAKNFSSNFSHSSSPTIVLDKSEVKTFFLPNGLTLLVQEDHTAPVVSIQAWCQAGSILENKFLGCGISHLLEHLLFKGTKTRGNSEIAQTLQAVGGYVNAYTSFDRTVFYVDGPSAGWKTILDVLTDVVFNSTLPQEEFAKEQEVIRREFAMYFDNPQSVLFANLFSTAFQVHPYRYPVIGHLELFNQLTHQNVLDYYHQFYIPNNLTFVVSGSVNPDEVFQLLSTATQSVPRQVLTDTYLPPEPSQLGRRERHQEFPTLIPRALMAWHTPGLTHPDSYALSVLAILAGEGVSSRLNLELVEKQNILNHVSAFSYSPTQSGLWGVSALIPPDSLKTLPEIEASILNILEDFKNTPVSAVELEKARRKVMVDRASELKTASGRASALGSSWLTTRTTSFNETYLKAIGQVQASDLQAVAKKYLNPEHLTVVSLRAAKNSLAPEIAHPSKIKSEVQLIQLKSGLRLVALCDHKVPLITVRALVRGGTLAETSQTNGISNLMARLLTKGTLKRSAQQIAEEIENLGGSIDAHSGNSSFSISLEVLQPDLDKAIELLSDVLLNPSFPENEIEQEKRQQLAEIQLQEDRPTAIAQLKLKAALFGSHPYGFDSLGSPETLNTITRAELKSFHQSLISTDQLVLTIGGSFNPDTLAEQFDRQFPIGLTSRTSPAPVPEPNFEGLGQTLSFDTPKQQAIVMIGFPGVNFSSSDRTALEILDEALSDLASRLFIRIRERQSLAYFVGTQQMIGFHRGMFVFYAGTAADKADLVRSEILDEIRLIVSEGLEESEVERSRAKLLGQRLLQDQSASATAYKAGLNLLYGQGIYHEATLNEKIRTLTLNEINTSAQKFFSEPNFVCVILKPNQPS